MAYTNPAMTRTVIISMNVNPLRLLTAALPRRALNITSMRGIEDAVGISRVTLAPPQERAGRYLCDGATHDLANLHVMKQIARHSTLTHEVDCAVSGPQSAPPAARGGPPAVTRAPAGAR